MIFRRALLRELTTNAIYVFVVLVAILVTQFLIKLIGAASAGSLPTDGLIPLVGFRLISQLPPLIVIAMFVSILLMAFPRVARRWMAIWMSAPKYLLSWRCGRYFHFRVADAGDRDGCCQPCCRHGPWRSIEYRRILEARDELSVLALDSFFRNCADQAGVLR